MIVVANSIGALRLCSPMFAPTNAHFQTSNKSVAPQILRFLAVARGERLYFQTPTLNVPTDIFVHGFVRFFHLGPSVFALLDRPEATKAARIQHIAATAAAA
jgi:hypothetical protein